MSEGIAIEGKGRGGPVEIGAKASLGVESNAYSWGSRDHQATSTAAGEPAIKYDDFILRARLAAAKVMKQEESWKWSEDFSTSLSHTAWKLSRDWKIGANANLVLPLTERSKKYTLLDEGVGGDTSLQWDLGHTVRGLSLKGAVGGMHYRYETPVAFDGISNEAWRLTTKLGASYEFAKYFSVDLLFGRVWAWSVDNHRFDRFETDESVSYSPTETVSIAIGHNRGGNVLRSDNTNNLGLYDDRDSSFYMSLDLQI